MKTSADETFGLLHEQLTLSTINEVFGGGFKKTADKYHPYDFVKESKEYIELKTRRCKHDTYPTAMIGLNKINYAKKNPECKFKLLYKYEDGLYYHDVDPTKNYQKACGGRADRGTPEWKTCCYVPREELIKV